jgi:hypothetical protein
MSKWWQMFLRHLISERLIQMGQSGMFIRFAHCLRRFAFKLQQCILMYFWRSSIWNIAPEQIFRGSSQITFQTHCLNANATIWKLNLLYNFECVRTFLMFDLLSKGTLWKQHKKSERQISGMFLDIQNTPHSFERGGVTHDSGSKKDS